ncbi:MAG: phosphotransferase-like protein [Akkermansia muciniphila]
MIFSMDDYLAMSRGSMKPPWMPSGVRPALVNLSAPLQRRPGKAPWSSWTTSSANPRWIQDLLNRLDGIPRILVKVECRQDVLLERERRRTDRTPAPAHAQRQHAGIHRHFPHDFSIDTSEDAPRKCAMRLISLLPGEFLP